MLPTRSSARSGRAAGLALALVVLSGCAREVPAVTAERRPLVQRVVASGRVMSPARVTLGALGVARVREVRVVEGERVRRGQLLVQLEDAEARAAIDGARARLAEATARVDQVRGPSVRTATEGLRQAEVELQVAERELDRVRRLADAGSGSAAQVDAAERTLAAARSRQEVAAVQAAGVASTGIDARLAAAALRDAQAQEAAAQARLDDRALRAPGDGTVLVRDAEPGDVVQPGKPLVVVSLDGDTRLSVQPDEKALALLAVGQPARAIADAFPDAPFDALVSYVAPAVDAARGTVEVRLRVASPPPFLRPDMTVSVNVEVARRSDALAVPADAVRDAASAPWVVVIDGGRAVRRDVRLGLRGEGIVEVIDGLAPGAAVVTPSGAARPGDRVRTRALPAAPEQARAL
jgi:HlyD family secretion protein